MFLTSAEADATFAQIAVEAVRQIHNKVVGMGTLSRCDHIRITGIWAAIADVVPNIVAEQHRLLRHQSHRPAQSVELEQADIGVAELNNTLLRIVETEQHLKQR